MRILASLVLTLTITVPAAAHNREAVAAAQSSTASLRAAIIAELCKARSNDDPEYWVRVMVEHHSSEQTADWPYWQNRIAIGDGVGKAPACESQPPTGGGSQGPPGPPGPQGPKGDKGDPGSSQSIDLSAIYARLAALEAAVTALQARPVWASCSAAANLGFGRIPISCRLMP